jgi:hypothetical protein
MERITAAIIAALTAGAIEFEAGQTRVRCDNRSTQCWHGFPHPPVAHDFVHPTDSVDAERWPT